jgi:uncharacterized membrane protein
MKRKKTRKQKRERKEKIISILFLIFGFGSSLLFISPFPLLGVILWIGTMFSFFCYIELYEPDYDPYNNRSYPDDEHKSLK